MQVGTNPATELKELRKKQNRPFSDILHQYVEEDLLKRIYESHYKEDIWFKDCLPWENDGTRISAIFKNKSQDALDDVMHNFVQELFKEEDDVSWIYNIRRLDRRYIIALSGSYKDMEVPITLELEALEGIEEINLIPEKKSFHLMLRQVIQINSYVYSSKTQIVDDLYEIIEKLELIGDMQSYALVNDALKSCSISGRHIMEGLSERAKKSPKVLKEKRISQLESYKNYSYMRKRWDKYCKNHIQIQDSWEDVVDRLIKFASPIWHALCHNEIFFDDWMPELERFLG